MSGYTPNKWVDREGTTRYFETIDADGAKIFTPDYTQVTEMGTPVNEDNMNHIEEGIAAGSFSKYDSMTTYEKDDLVTAIIDNELKVYKSLQDNNNGNTLTDTTFWEEVEFTGGGAGLQLFDLIEKDHILTYEESKGLALLGSYVYKEAVAGSRYGYPDFYNKVVEEYNNSTDTTFLNSGIAWTQPTNPSGITASSGFSEPDSAFDKDDTTYASCGTTTDYIDWDLGETLYITGFNATGNYVSSVARACDLALYVVDSKGNETLIADGTGASNAASYTTSATFDGVYASKIRFKISTNIEPTTQYPSRFIQIDLIANTCVSTKRNSNGHCFYDIADKIKIDNVYNTSGVAWFYGVDTENERVFLPRNDYFFKNSTVDDVSTKVNPELPNITGGTVLSSHSADGAPTGAFYTIRSSANSNCQFPGNGRSYTAQGEGFDASLSNSIYKDGGTVVADGVNVLVYMCVGNTETKSTITDVVDVTTTENDTTPLFTAQYFDFTPNNISWLKGGQQANSGGIYTTAYNELINILNGETKYGDLKVIDVANMVSGEDYSEYWKVNQDEMYFVAPTKISYLPINADTAPVVGNGTSLGLTDGTYYVGIGESSDNGRIYINTRFYNMINGTTSGSSSYATANDVALGVTTDAEASGLIADLSSAKSQTAQLYFKVANAVQNLELLDAGAVMEAVADKISRQDCKAYVTEISDPSLMPSWYKVYSNGLCEQGGLATYVSSEATVSLIMEYRDKDYTVQLTDYDANDTGGLAASSGLASQTTTDFVISTTSEAAAGIFWETKGYIS